MRALLVVGLIAGAVAVPSAQPPFVQFVTGLIEGLDPSLGGNATACITNDEAAFNDVRQGFQYFDQGLSTLNVTALYDGIMSMEAALQSIKAAAIQCGDAQLVADIDALLQKLGEEPFIVIAMLMPYLRQVVGDITTAVSDWKAANFTGAGYNVGLVLAIILNKTERQAVAGKVGQTLPPYTQFLNGVLMAVEPSVAGNITTCVPAVDSGSNDVDQAIVLLEAAVANRSVALLLQAATMAENGLLILRTASAACNEPEAAADFAKIVNDIETNPLGVAARLFPYSATIFGDVENGIAAWQGQQWQQAGQDFGGVLALVLTTA